MSAVAVVDVTARSTDLMVRIRRLNFHHSMQQVMLAIHHKSISCQVREAQQQQQLLLVLVSSVVPRWPATSNKDMVVTTVASTAMMVVSSLANGHVSPASPCHRFIRPNHPTTCHPTTTPRIAVIPMLPQSHPACTNDLAAIRREQGGKAPHLRCPLDRQNEHAFPTCHTMSQAEDQPVPMQKAAPEVAQTRTSRPTDWLLPIRYQVDGAIQQSPTCICAIQESISTAGVATARGKAGRQRAHQTGRARA